MNKNPSVFAVMFANRDLFPSGMLKAARKELEMAITGAGFGVLLSPEDMTPYGAVKNVEEGRKFASFLRNHKGKFDGVICSLPNFGDENGAAEALRDAEVPILIHAYPDTLDAMGPEERRDSFCGKLSIMNVLRQYGIPFTAFKPHVINPADPQFTQQLHDFDGVCRLVKRMKRCTLGALGARTSAFKTVRFDELAMQKHGITVESLDLSDIFARVKKVDSESKSFMDKKNFLHSYACFNQASAKAFENLVRLGIVLDNVIEEFNLDTLALRCWLEIEKELQISPCVLLGALNNQGISAACEMDGATAAAMFALRLAADRPSACLDWNNNYAEDENSCILFHCGPVATDMLSSTGEVINHAMFDRVLGPGVSCGCHPGRIAPGKMTFAGAKTEDGSLCFYLGEGEFTAEPIPENFFGCGGVAKIQGLQEKLLTIGTNGYHHHVGAVHGSVGVIIREAFETYLQYPLTAWIG